MLSFFLIRIPKGEPIRLDNLEVGLSVSLSASTTTITLGVCIGKPQSILLVKWQRVARLRFGGSHRLIEQFFTTMVSNKLEFHSCILQRCKIFTQDAVFLLCIKAVYVH